MLAAQPMFTLHVELDDILAFGATPYGERRVVNIVGGRVMGERLNGRILPGGADWQIIRSDGVADIRARYTIEAEDGGLILVNSEGLRHGPQDVIARLSRGEPVDPALYYFRTVLRFETAAPPLSWLNKMLTIGRGQREARAVRLDVFEVT
jgi:Protein of unknown function (DUF3237)